MRTKTTKRRLCIEKDGNWICERNCVEAHEQCRISALLSEKETNSILVSRIDREIQLKSTCPTMNAWNGQVQAVFFH
jgi:predicted Zn-dependent peptidase